MQARLGGGYQLKILDIQGDSILFDTFDLHFHRLHQNRSNTMEIK